MQTHATRTKIRLMQTYMYASLQIDLHACKLIDRLTCMQTYKHTYMCASIQADLHVWTTSPLCLCKLTCWDSCNFGCVQTHVYTYIHAHHHHNAHAHLHVCNLTYMHTCMQSYTTRLIWMDDIGCSNWNCIGPSRAWATALENQIVFQVSFCDEKTAKCTQVLKSCFSS
jgi:hypothetical protein